MFILDTDLKVLCHEQLHFTKHIIPPLFCVMWLKSDSNEEVPKTKDNYEEFNCPPLFLSICSSQE